MKSPIKWVGSKKKTSSKIISKFSKDFGIYYELFAGSAVVLFNLEPKNAVISDINEELTNFYKVLRDTCDDLIVEIKKLQVNEKTYYEVRDWDKSSSWPFSSLERATRFLYLNRTCFNGLWRVNSKGCFNASYGKKDLVGVDFRFELLRKSSEFLKRVKICNKDFEEFLPDIQKNDIVYLDPPYAVNENSHDSNYNSNDFTKDDQLRVFKFCKELDKKGTQFVLSNSYSEDIAEVYKDFIIDVVDVRRCVGPTENTRRNVKEIIITNRSR
jgi:DNA adenine methylase